MISTKVFEYEKRLLDLIKEEFEHGLTHWRLDSIDFVDDKIDFSNLSSSLVDLIIDYCCEFTHPYDERKRRCVNFRVFSSNISVELGEDNWFSVDENPSDIRHFWVALLGE